MSETELLLKDAAEIAKRYFVDPTEQAVMQIFGRLSFERDCHTGGGLEDAMATRH